jgi:hypothetical protein
VGGWFLVVSFVAASLVDEEKVERFGLLGGGGLAGDLFCCVELG